MPYCMCNEDFNFCNCDEHICHKHGKKVTLRPPTPNPFLNDFTGSQTVNFSTEVTT